MSSNQDQENQNQYGAPSMPPQGQYGMQLPQMQPPAGGVPMQNPEMMMQQPPNPNMTQMQMQPPQQYGQQYPQQMQPGQQMMYGQQPQQMGIPVVPAQGQAFMGMVQPPRLTSINPEKLSNDNFTMTQTIYPKSQKGVLAFMCCFGFIGFVMTRFFIPEYVVIPRTITFFFFTMWCSLLVFGTLTTPTKIEIKSDKMEDKITVTQEFMFQFQRKRSKRPLSELTDIREKEHKQQANRSDNDHGSYSSYEKTIGYQYFLLFKNHKQLMFYVPCEDSEKPFITDELDLFILNGQARRDSDYTNVNPAGSCAQCCTVCGVMLVTFFILSTAISLIKGI